MDFIIKKLSEEDINRARQLFRFFQIDDGIDPVISPNEYIKNLLSKNDFHVLVAMQNDKLVGGLTSYELPMYKEQINEMLLYEIAVKPGYREMGVATLLINFLKDFCRDRGIKEMYVGTSTDNHAALKLYRSSGGVADQNIAWFVYSC
jgi:aminoglycoside 3-N-acetyltransferase I